MGNSASSHGSSTGTHDGDVGSSISEEQHDWFIEQAADTPDVQSLWEMRKPYTHIKSRHNKESNSYSYTYAIIVSITRFVNYLQTLSKTAFLYNVYVVGQ